MMRFSQGMARACLITLAASAGLSVGTAQESSGPSKRQPNNFPEFNANGFAATFSTQGFVDLTGEYFQAQGTNGRSCATCHIPQNA
ncbi:MAG TPA: hypothetical protein VKE70_31945, partial [Candidatus Solibacter sp.]|nr:hypothetical protein [Candidatus Solibacter sp.]